MTERTSDTWYIVKRANGQCDICDRPSDKAEEDIEHWGPFADADTAMARRVGLIRAGKCQPQ